jgi:DNA-binding MarR family transcriptional regulator
LRLKLKERIGFPAVEASSSSKTADLREVPPEPHAGSEGLNLAGLENSIAFSLRLAQAASFAAFAKRVEEAGLRPGHYAILHLIAANPGVAQTALSRASGRDKSTLTPILVDLSRRGLVIREGCDRDRRTLRLSLTDKGRAKLDFLARHAAAHDELLDAVVGPENKPMMIESLVRITEALNIVAASTGGLSADT